MSGNLGLLQKLLVFPQSFEPEYVPRCVNEGKKPYGLFWHSRTRKGSPLALEAIGEDVKTIFCALLQCGWMPDELTWFVIADRNRQSLAQALFEYNYRFNFSFKERHPLLGPIKRRNQEFDLILLKAGINVNGSSVHSRSSLQFAIELGDAQMIDCLLKAGADVNPSSGYYPFSLQLTVKLGSVEMVDCLLKVGADVNALAI
ncbi:hypothetical protein F4679DRAFT_588673 [Xylaria curta]|nr:hypothetical protein F4679DRAFT_588673 [Xylaria curta]